MDLALKINLGHSQGCVYLPARKLAGSLLSSSPPQPLPTEHGSRQPVQVTAKLSLAKRQGHKGRGPQVVGQNQCFIQTVTLSLARAWE